MAAELTPERVNTITWTEIPCTDLTRVQEFYSNIFNWTMSPFDSSSNPSDPSVALFSHNATQGCFIRLPAENLLSPAKHPDNPGKGRIAVRVTISVQSVDDILKKVEAKGGKVYQPKGAIPGGHGFVAYFTDSEENVMGLWSAK